MQEVKGLAAQHRLDLETALKVGGHHQFDSYIIDYVD